MKTFFSCLLLSCALLLISTVSVAQDSLRFRNDSSRFQRDSASGRPDSGRYRRGGTSSLFADTATLSSSDYQLQIEKTYVVLNNIESKSDLAVAIKQIETKLADDDSVLTVLKDNILNNAGALNLRNLQVFETLLQDIKSDLKVQRQFLDSSDNMLNGLRSNMATLITDTVLRQLMRDSVLREQFSPQLKVMREAWRSATRHLRQSIAAINLLQTHTSSNIITSSQLQGKVSNLITTSATRIFGKEFNYLWEADTNRLTRDERSSFRKAYAGERKALHYYFKDSGNKRLLLLLFGILFFVWVYRNTRTLRRRNAIDKISGFGFEYLPAAFIISAFVVMLSLAPFFDLHAPSAYIEGMQFLLVMVLTIICWKKWPRNLFLYWIALTVLFICFSFSHHMMNPGLSNRLWFILLNVLSIVFGILFLRKMDQHLNMRGFLRFVIMLHNVMNVLAIVCNLFGRFSLAQILGNAAIFAFMQSVGLAVFSKICMEAILLQIITSRVKRGVLKQFDATMVLKSFGTLVRFIVILLWLIVFANNLNIYTSALNALSDFLQTPREIGNATFTIGGVLVFFMIIWIAHLLQRYIGYFFGDTGADDDMQNKKQRSRLLITRLVLLCAGYLLAVAASGVPVDKITIVLGALGVGIGLGLQNIVNNFVSGIILIFDRPLQIGDIVEVGSKSGRVREIGLRSSTLLTKDGAEIIIPNGDILSQQITNWTLSNSQQRLEMDISVSGSTDMEHVSSAVKKAIQSSKYIYEDREPQILFTKVNDDGFDLKAFFWCEDVAKSDEAKSETLLLLHEKLKENGISVK
ncbi:MAG: mechanosensitive ion channel [Chitinophagaceae bacterium]